MNPNTASLDASLSVPAVIGSGLPADDDRRRAIRSAIGEVARYRSLPAGWNGEGGLPACPKAADFAQQLLEQILERPEIRPPFVCPISTGVFLQWEIGDATLYFEVDEDSVLSVMHRGDAVLESDDDPRFDVDRACGVVVKFHEISQPYPIPPRRLPRRSARG